MTNTARDRRPVGNAFWTDADGNPTGGVSSGQGFTIAWQNGVQERNGAFLEEVVEACMARLAFFQESKFASEFNERAIWHLNAALGAMAARLADRTERGVEGTYQV